MLNRIGQSLFIATVTTLLATTAYGQDLAGVKCIVKGDNQASADSSAEYKDGKVYFCCENCLAKFNAESEKESNSFATKANHQLVLTKQYQQTACPITGKKLAEGATAQVGGAKVGFCCKNCVAKVEGTSDLAAKAELVFSNAAFEKGYTLVEPEFNLKGVKCIVKGDNPVKEEFSADHDVYKVFFCCAGCQSEFEKNPANYTAKANFQLVATGQVEQSACPISGQEIDEEQVSDVAGVEVKLCCKNCKAKVDQAEGDAKVELVFGEKGFKKGYHDDE